MAKKKTKVEVEETSRVVETPVVEAPVVETPKLKKVELKKPEWEIKDRVYYLTKNLKPLSYSIKSTGVYYFDEEKGYERELKYCQNQKTCFVDEMTGIILIEIIFIMSGNQKLKLQMI